MFRPFWFFSVVKLAHQASGNKMSRKKSGVKKKKFSFLSFLFLNVRFFSVFLLAELSHLLDAPKLTSSKTWEQAVKEGKGSRCRSILLKENILQTMAWVSAQRTFISIDKLPSSENGYHHSHKN